MKIGFCDMHCDTLLRAFQAGEEFLYNGDGMQSITKMRQAGQMMQFFAVFFRPAGRKMPFDTREMPDDETYFAEARQILLHQTKLHSDEIAMAYSAADIEKNRAEGKASAVLTMEDGRMVQGSMERLIRLQEEGVRAIALTWNFANCFGSPNSKDPEVMNTGLTAFGKEAVGVMNDIGIIVDVSHLSDGGFYDVAALSKKPFIASHSNCRALTDHTRNLTDEMIRILADAGGVAGLNLGYPFVVPTGSDDDWSRMEYLVSHVMYMWKTGGEDILALGSDFDGVAHKLDIKDSTMYPLLFDELKKAGMPERVIDKLAYENVLRVMKDAIG